MHHTVMDELVESLIAQIENRQILEMFSPYEKMHYYTGILNGFRKTASAFSLNAEQKDQVISYFSRRIIEFRKQQQ